MQLVYHGVCIGVECAVVSICRRANLFQYMHHCLQAHMFFMGLNVHAHKWVLCAFVTVCKHVGIQKWGQGWRNQE